MRATIEIVLKSTTVFIYVLYIYAYMGKCLCVSVSVYLCVCASRECPIKIYKRLSKQWPHKIVCSLFVHKHLVFLLREHTSSHIHILNKYIHIYT